MRSPTLSLPHPRRSLLLLAGITVVAAAFRFWQLDRIPPGFHYDEAYEALEAWALMTRPGYHPIFFTGNFGVDPMFIYLTSLAFRVFGAEPVVMRGVAAVIGTLTVPALYAMGRELVRLDTRIPACAPLLAAAALAVLRWHVFFSRTGIEPVLVPFFLVLMLWAFFRAVRTNGLGAWVALGLTAALGCYTYQAGLLLPFLAVALVIYLLAADRARLCGRRRGLLLAGGVAALVAAPLALYFVGHMDQLILRSSQIAVGDPSGETGTFLDGVLRTAGMFSIRGDMDPRSNLPGLPALDVLIAIPFYLGLLLAAWRWRRPAFGSLLLAGAIMLAPTVFSEDPPHFRRAVGAAPMAAMLIGIGLAVILGRPEDEPARLLGSGLAAPGRAAAVDRLQPALRRAVVIALLLGSAVLSGAAYFQNWGDGPEVFYAYDQGLWEIGAWVRGLPEGEQLYITPRPASDMTLAFAWREGSAVRHFDGRHAFRVAERLPATYISIEYEDFRGSGLLHQIYPQATETRVFRDRQGQVYARAFRVSAAEPGEAARRPLFDGNAQWQGMEMAGYDLNEPIYHPGEVVYLQLWWRVTGAVPTDWTVFTHLLDREGAVRAGRDARPGEGSVPTTNWVPGELILDEYQIQLPPDLPAGAYAIEVGLYDPANGGARAGRADQPGLDYAILGQVEVE